MNILKISPSPHIKGGLSTRSIMYGVVIALIPALAVSVYFFGLDALKLSLVSVVSCVFFEWFIQKYLLKGNITIPDGSAVITGLLLAFNVPSSLPVWMIIAGSLIAIGIAKMSFGGLGNNPFNPALIGRVFLLISFPADMTSWPNIKPLFGVKSIDGVTCATFLGSMKESVLKGSHTISEFINTGLPVYNNNHDIIGYQQINHANTFFGMIGGSLGEISALALLIGATYLLIRKIITWHIPFSYILTVFVFSGIMWYLNPDKYIDPVYHLFTGGLILGAFFMATDMVTSPMTPLGMIIFGTGCGILTIVIRLWGAYPEGVSFAILIMNSVTPLINRSIKPKKFGEVQHV